MPQSDEDVLAWAARNDRCLVTENVGDFARLVAVGVAHAGVVFASAQRFPRTPSGLVRIAADVLIAAKRLPPRGGVIWLSPAE